MATCIPPAERAHSESSAELRLLEALDAQLTADFTVLHSVAWISKPGASGPRDGESDLLVVHPRHGLLVIEVKGGRVSLDYRYQRWSSVDRNGNEHQIKNPFEQAKRGKYGILEKLRENPAWQRLGIRRFNIGHAAFLPDVGDAARLRGPDAPGEIIGDRGDIERLLDWTEQALRYWAQDEAGRLDELGQRGVEAIVATFARRATTRPLLSARIQDEERERTVLTERQVRILDILQRRRRVMVAGGAGTGKTLIAREKAIRAADDGMRTLLVCYNRPLADHLREQCEGQANLDVASFHQVCSAWIAQAKKETGRDLLEEARRDHPRASEFDHLMPLALANAVDLLGPAYDAIVVDEGQDFGDEFWLPTEMLLKDLENGLLYVFLDENQDIYRRSASIPVKGEPMVLDQNCRNTGAVHRAAYRHYRGAAMIASPIEGTAVAAVTANGLESQAKSVGALLTRLLVEEQIPAHDIGVLICDGASKAQCERALASLPLPKTVRLGRLEDYGPNIVTVDTVARFKGLEREVVILWAFDSADPVSDREMLYVGMSRAKAVLYLCGSREACARVAEAGQ
jgi:hypothetical protein